MASRRRVQAANAGTPVRLPVAPLMRAANLDTDSDLARCLGYRNVRDMARTIDWYRLKREGLTWNRADQLAVALGRHPMEVWGDDWLEAQRESRPCATSQKLKPLRREPRWGLIRAEVESMGDEKRDQIMVFIADSIREQGYPPTVREIGAAVGLRSPASVHHHLAQLQVEGRLTVVPGSPRAMRIVEAA